MSFCNLCDSTNPSTLIDFRNYPIDFLLNDLMEKESKFMTDVRPPIFLSYFSYFRKIDICLLVLNTENEKKVINLHSNWAMQGGLFWSIFPPNHRLLTDCESNVMKNLVAP